MEKNFKPLDFQQAWAELNTKYSEQDKEKRKTIKKMVKDKLEADPSIYPDDVFWPSTVECDIRNWPNSALGKAGKEFVLSMGVNTGRKILLMSSVEHRPKSVVLEWEPRKFESLLAMARTIMDFCVDDFSWRVNRLAGKYKASCDEHFLDDSRGALSELNTLLEWAGKPERRDRIRSAWGDLDETLPEKLYRIDTDDIKELIETNPVCAEQLACIVIDALNTFPERDDYHCIAEDDRHALFLWKWDGGETLAFLRAAREVMEDGK